MSETKLSSMTPDERARNTACERGRDLAIKAGVANLIGQPHSWLLCTECAANIIATAESEAASAAFLRGFEAAREASAKIVKALADQETFCRSAIATLVEPIRALTPADARASSIPGAASETVIHRQSSEGAQPPGSSSAGSRDSAPSADASAPGSECPVATRSAGDSFDPTTESAHEMRDADRGGSDAAAGY